MDQTIFQYLYCYIFATSWRDNLQIIILAVILYRFLTWLAQDTNPLIETLCCTYILACTTWLLNLSTISIIFWHLMPFLAMLLVIFHQHTLQKHYITWRTSGQLDNGAPEWQALLMKLTIRAGEKNISLLWTIECQDALDQYFVGGNLHARITAHLMELIFSSPQNTLHHIWITKTGIVRAHNPHIIVAQEHLSLSPDIAALSPILQKMHVLSTQHDCIILYNNTAERTYTLIHHATTQQHLTAHNCLNMLMKLTHHYTNQEYIPCASYHHSVDQHQQESPGRSS